MFERFTDRARRVVVLAQEHARLCGQTHVEPEHVLLGVLDAEGPAVEILGAFGVSVDDVRRRVTEQIGRSDRVVAGHVAFTSRGKKVLESALREALQLGCNYIGTEHILLGILRQGEGVAAQVLADADVNLAAYRAKVTERLTAEDKARAKAWRATRAERLAAHLAGLVSLSLQAHEVDDLLEALRRELKGGHDND